MIVVTKILIIFIMIGVGFIIGKLNVLSEESNIHISKLVIMIGTPCMLFNAITRSDFNAETFKITIEMLVGTIIFFIVATILAFIITKLLVLTKDNDVGIYLVIITTINGSFMGFPLMQAVFGETGLFLMAIENIVFNIYLYSLGIILIRKAQMKKQSLKQLVKDICNPCILASIIGFMLLCCNVNLPSIITEPISQIANITVPLAMISVGLSMCNSNCKKIIKNYKLILVCLMKCIVLPIIMFLIIYFTMFTPIVKNVLVLMAALPSAVSMGVLVKKLGGNAILASEGVVVSTAISIVTLPIIYMCLINFVTLV